MRYLLLFFLPLTAWAQFGVEQPFFSAPATSASQNTPQSLGANYLWVYTDIATNNVAASSWPDAIKGSIWGNTGSSTTPTNTSIGVNFDRASSQSLTNSGVWFSTNNTQYIILQRTSTSAWQELLATADTSVAILFYNTLLLYLNVNANPKALDTGNKGTSSFYDIVITASGSGAPSQCYYTNGFLCTSNWWAPSGGLGNVSWTRLGTGPDGYFGGYIKEVGVWTNTAINSNSVWLLHQYATNKYGFSP